jgi:cystathionine beta-lyase
LKYDFDTPVNRAGTWSTRWDRYAGRDILPLWVADTDFRAPPAVLDALSARIAHGVLGYTAVPDELREAVVERMERLYRWRIAPSWIVFLPGVVPGLHLAARTLTRSGEHIVVPTPVYQHLTRAAQLAPRAHSSFPLVLDGGRWVFDLDALRKAVSSKTRLLFLCNPQNPGGTVFTRGELSRLAETARDLVIVSDEIHCDLVLEEKLRHVPIATLGPEISRRTVTLMSPNKSFNFPAAGCAWAIIEDAALRQAFAADVQAHAVPSPSVFGYAAALAAYREGDAWLAAQIEYLRDNRDRVEKVVATWPSVSMAHVEATYLAWIDCSALGLRDPAAHFVEHGVGLSPGSQFGADQFVRLNFGTQSAVLEKGLARMGEAVQAARRG